MQPPLKCFITQLQTCLEQIGEKRNLSKETQDDQMVISELKNIKTEIKKKKFKRRVQQPVEKRKESVNWKTEYKIPNLNKTEKNAMKKMN